jgi:catechol 2,3-dioxygenase-like lactoylglutathione lyase family enzyme
MRGKMQLNQVTVPSRDVPRAMGFYKTLGFRQIVDAAPRYARFVCPGGDATLSLHHDPEPPSGAQIVIYFECDDLDATVDALKSKGVRFDSDPVDQRWLWREAYLRDPDGNRICLYYAGRNRLDPPWRIADDG